MQNVFVVFVIMCVLWYRVSTVSFIHITNPNGNFSKRTHVNRIPRIVGGHSVKHPNPYPWIVHISGSYSNNGVFSKFVCAGTAIQKDLVLTSSRCMPKVPFSASLSIGKKSRSPSQTVGWLNAVYHIGYNSTTFENDIAAFQTDEDWDLEKFPMISNFDPKIGTAAIIAGWGRKKKNQKKMSNKLQALNVNFLSSSDCSIFEGYKENFNFCAGADGAGICNGDIGGPLFTTTDCCTYPGVIQHGIITQSKDCATNPIEFTQVATYLPWIDQALAFLNMTKQYNQPVCCRCKDGVDDIGTIKQCKPPVPTPTSLSSPSSILHEADLSKGNLLLPLSFFVWIILIICEIAL
jgi:secreted trypsin-like serine protease